MIAIYGLHAATIAAQIGGEVGSRVQLVAVIASIVMLAFVFELVRRRALVERYALIWMSATFGLLVLAIWRELLGDIADLLGIAAPVNALFLIVLGVTFLLLLHFSVVSSRLGEETKILAQEVARLRQELDDARSGDVNGAAGSDAGSEHGSAPQPSDPPGSAAP